MYSENVKPVWSSSRDGQPLVSLNDLQRVSLRKTQCSKTPNKLTSTADSENRSDEVVDVRQFLKRTKLSRSPGGTPLPGKRKLDVKTSSTPVSLKHTKGACSQLIF
ncbi:proline-rich protein 11 [Elysia marginata]|uniref:Proline-rich protein 11 n=1 Tax=Elysia marginata TaxID=1093978 RepID=A0AAV4EXF8_9GAST|nr:proline-rich protein 11 [Elysia marginata]